MTTTRIRLGALMFAGLAVTLAAPAAFAQERPDFETLDLDGSGEITADEMKAHAATRFADRDADGDGKVDLAELQTHLRAQADARAARMLDRMDTNGDGALTEDEMAGRRDPARMIARMDTDGSGGLSKEEFAEARERFGHRMGGQMKPKD